MTKETYRCLQCEGVFPLDLDWEAEAEAEYRAAFDEEYLAGAARAIVCEDCYLKLPPSLESAR